MASPNRAAKGASQPRRSIAQNRRARHDYHVLDELECGIMLLGTEVKSLRGGQCSLQEAFVRITGEELWLMRSHIPEYAFGNSMNHEPLRPRKLLAHKHQIRKWGKRAKEKGVTMVPLEVYFDGSKVKVLVGLVQGKRLHDKRSDLKERQDKRDMDRAMARRRRE
ncbi:MAG: SsrA-binding protein SmpB [Planctomycetota bacterium]